MTLSTKLNHLPPLTPLPSADTMRSVQIDASAHHHLLARASVPCVALAGTPETASCVMPNFAPPTSCLPSLGAVLLAAPLAAQKNGFGIVKALTPAALTSGRRVSPLTPLCLPAVPLPTTQAVRWPLCQSSQRHRLFQASPPSSRLATGLRRIGFVLLRTGGSPPAAPHPASRRRSCLRLRSYDALRQGLAPC